MTVWSGTNGRFEMVSAGKIDVWMVVLICAPTHGKFKLLDSGGLRSDNFESRSACTTQTCWRWDINFLVVEEWKRYSTKIFFICGFKPHEHAMLRLKTVLNMTRYGNLCRGKRSTMIAMFMQFKDSGNQRWEPTTHPPNTCHVCFEGILIPDTPYEEVSPAIIVLDFPGHFSGTKFPHNAQQLKSSSWAKLVHGCAPQVWYLGRVSGVLRDAKSIWLAQQPKYDEYIVPVIPDTSMPSSVGRILAIDDRSWYRWILILGIMGSRWLSRLIIILQFRTEFHHLCNSITAQMRNRSREKHKQSPVSPSPPRTEPCPARPSRNASAWKWCSGATWRSGKPCGPKASGPRESASWWLNARSTRHGVRLKWSCRPPWKIPSTWFRRIGGLRSDNFESI